MDNDDKFIKRLDAANKGAELRKTHIDVLPAMTKREYAAIHIMARMAEFAGMDHETVSKEAIDAADALLKQLEGE